MSTIDRFLVIGSNSFSGASFVAGALQSGAEVAGISRSPEADPVFLPYRWPPPPPQGSSAADQRFTFHQLDLNHDLDAIEKVLRDFQPPYVVNYSAQGMVAQSWQNPEHWYQTNTIAMIRLHERLRHMPFLKKFIQASTPEVYGNTSGLVREDAPFNPSTPYAVSKAACDMNLLAYHRAYNFPVAFTRAANVCGPGQALYRIIPKTILCVLTGKKLRLEGGGQSLRSFIHIRDVVEATLAIARHPGSSVSPLPSGGGREGGASAPIYHLSTTRQQTIRSLVESICSMLGVNFADCVDITPGRLGQDSAYLLDATRVKNDLGWQPKLTAEDAVRDTIDWMKKNIDHLKTLPADYVHKP